MPPIDTPMPPLPTATDAPTATRVVVPTQTLGPTETPLPAVEIPTILPSPIPLVLATYTPGPTATALAGFLVPADRAAAEYARTHADPDADAGLPALWRSVPQSLSRV